MPIVELLHGANKRVWHIKKEYQGQNWSIEFGFHLWIWFQYKNERYILRPNMIYQDYGPDEDLRVLRSDEEINLLHLILSCLKEK